MKSASIKRALRRFSELGGETRKSNSIVTYWRTSFALPCGADYAFSANIYEKGGASLSAERAHIVENEYFWNRGYALADYQDMDGLLRVLVNEVAIVLQNRSRIRHTRGLVMHAFSCECFRGGNWELLSRTSAFRFGGFRFPPTKQRVTEYSSPPQIA